MVPPPSAKPGQLELDFRKDPQILAVLGDELAMAVFSVDTSGRFVGWSKGAEQATGYSLREIQGQPCQMFEGPNCKGFRSLRELLDTAAPTSVAIERQECRIYRKDSRLLHLLGSAKLLRDDAGAVYGAIGAFTDITDVLNLNAPQPRVASTQGLAGLIGASSAMKEVFRRIQLAADSDVTTLITGESGTGKELAARAIHSLSARRDKPFVAVNCSAIPESLLESELFGHVKGAFTGAIRDGSGVFASADGGTLFLDEIGDVSQLLQVKLLRVLQEREVRRVGDPAAVPVDVRLLTATNRDLQEQVKEGTIREDFYYRIRVFDIRMPPLHERVADIPLLAQSFLEQVARSQGKRVHGIARDALEALIQYRWPGNVRELYNAIEHAMVVQRGDDLGLLDLPVDVRRTSTSPVVALGQRDLTPAQEAERLRILDALEENAWNRTKTSASLGVSRVTLWKKIRRYQIDEGIFKRGTRDDLGL